MSGFSVPAVNIRGLTYDTARAMFRAEASSTYAQAEPLPPGLTGETPLRERPVKR